MPLGIAIGDFPLSQPLSSASLIVTPLGDRRILGPPERAVGDVTRYGETAFATFAGEAWNK